MLQAALRVLLFGLCAVGLGGVAFAAGGDGAAPAAALAGASVDDFRLTDHNGVSHRLFYDLASRKAVVIAIQAEGCGAVKTALPVLSAVRSQDVEVLMLDSSRAATAERVLADTKRLNTDIPVLLDSSQIIGEALNATKAGEVILIDAKTRKIAYRGAAAQLRDAVESVVAGAPVKAPVTPVAGCPVKLDAPKLEAAAYAKVVAPILIDKCVSCHQAGGVAPFAMNKYEIVRGFAPMMRETVRTGRMPPWHADPHYQTFVGDRSLSDPQKATLIRWIEAGAPRGSGPDPLTTAPSTAKEWAFGKPDLIVEVPPFDVPASGVIEYQHMRVRNPLDHDVWVRAYEAKPGARSNVHHMITMVDDPFAPGRDAARVPSPSKRGNVEIGKWSPGEQPINYGPEGAVLLPKGVDLVFEIHYTTSGKAMTDHSKIGLYFADAPPKYVIQSSVVDLRDFEVPPFTPAYTAMREKVWQDDVVVYNVEPHAHVRGTAAKMTAYYPDGRSEVLVNVPKYDFNWQSVYAFDKPKLVPKGTKFVYAATWDNSPQNPFNPNPAKTVRYGEQSFEEMGQGWMNYRVVGMTPERYLQERAAKMKQAADAAPDKTPAAAAATTPAGR